MKGNKTYRRDHEGRGSGKKGLHKYRKVNNNFSGHMLKVWRCKCGALDIHTPDRIGHLDAKMMELVTASP